MAEEIIISDESLNNSEASDDEIKMETEPVIDKQKLADQKKDEGNQFYKQHKYNDALECYSHAIDLCPNCAAYYGNRAACHMMVHNYLYALEDASQAVRLDPAFIKGYLREVRCQVALGDIAAAKRTIERIRDIDPKTPELTAESRQVTQLEEHLNRVDQLWNRKEYRQALFHIDQLLRVSVACTNFKLKRAECLALLARYQESQEIANDILMKDNLNADAIYIRGLCLYYQDNVDKAVTHFQSVLQLAPDHQKALDAYKKTKVLKQKKEAGNTAFKNGDYQEAYNLYTSALAVDPNNIATNAKLYFNRATVCSKIKKTNQAVEDSSNAIKLDPNYIKAYLRRAKSYVELEMYEEAVADYETVYQKDKSRENRKLLDMAKLELKKSKRKDYYKVLGVGKNASDDEIKKAYKKQALIHHPDRHSHETDEKKLQQEKKFKELGEAYNILSDPKKKSRYDNGLDLEEDGVGGGGFQDLDPNMFSSFFAGPGGFHFGAGGGQNHFSSQGFPRSSGFQFQFS